MGQKITIFLIIFFSAIFQLAVFSNSFFWGLGPDILLVMVILWTAREGFERALFANILAGLVLDLITFSPVGMHIASFVAVAFFVSFISKRFLVVASSWRILILAATIIFGTLANNIFLGALFLAAEYFKVTGVGNAPVSFFSLVLVKLVVLNVLFSPLLYFSLKKIERLNFFKTQSKSF